MRVMDFGAGTGLISAAVAPHVAEIVAVDISRSMLDQLASKPELAGKVQPVCRNILVAPLTQRFDLIMSAMAMHHVADTAALLSTFWDHLVDGGRLALADLDAEDGSFHPAATDGVFHHGFDRSALETMLVGAGFKDIQFRTAHTVDKGDGRYPVFLVTAAKS